MCCTLFFQLYFLPSFHDYDVTIANFNFLTVQGIYAELQPRRDRYFSTERTCSVYFINLAKSFFMKGVNTERI